MDTVKIKVIRKTKGGPGSGNWGHVGRPGKRGGSAPQKGLAVKVSSSTRSPSYHPFLPPMGTSAGAYITTELKSMIDSCVGKVLQNTTTNLSRIGIAVDDMIMPGNVLGYHQPIFNWREGKLDKICVVMCTNKITNLGNQNIIDKFSKDTGIKSDFSSAFEHVLMHEFGHEAYIQLPGSKKASWKSAYNSTKSYNTPYGRTNAQEGFSEMFALWINGYNVNAEIANWMVENVGAK